MPNYQGTISDFDATEAFNKLQDFDPNVALIQSELVKLLKTNLPILIDKMNSELGLSIEKPTKFFEAPEKLDDKFIHSVVVGFSDLRFDAFAPTTFLSTLTLGVYIIGKPIRSPVQTPDMWRWAAAANGVLHMHLNGYCTENGTRLWGKLTPNQVLGLPEQYEDYSGASIMLEMQVHPGGRAWKPVT